MGDLASHLIYDGKHIALIGKPEHRQEIKEGMDRICPGLRITPNFFNITDNYIKDLNFTFNEIINVPKLTSRLDEFDTVQQFRK